MLVLEILTRNYGIPKYFNKPQPQPQPQISLPSEAAIRAIESKIGFRTICLAILEKLASRIGTLGFIWATVVLLGGFAGVLEKDDFWFITTILFIEGVRVLSRSHEFELQHNAGGVNIIMASRQFVHELKFLFKVIPIARNRAANRRDQVIIVSPPRLFSLKKFSELFYWLQLVSAITCIILPVRRLYQRSQYHGEIDRERKNVGPALTIFYALALLEAFLFIVESSYRDWTFSDKLLDLINSNCDLGPSGRTFLDRFIHDSYFKCINGSIFDGTKIDLVTYVQELVMATSKGQQLMGVEVLHKFVDNPVFSEYTLRKIESSSNVVERLIDMLNWKNVAEEAIRKSAAAVLSKLAGKKQNAVRIAAIPGAMESIASLLFTIDGVNCNEFNILGLHILKELANDHDNCGRIGSTPGLLAKIVDFTSVSELEMQKLEQSLQVLKLLASTAGDMGKVVRREILGIVFTVSNIRKILQYAASPDILQIQKLGIEILTSLSIEEEGREKIGATGGMINKLLGLYMEEGSGAIVPEDDLRGEAGEALAMLTLDNVKNCEGVLKKNQVVMNLVASLSNIEVRKIRISSFRILKNLCAFGEIGHCIVKLRGVGMATPIVLNIIMNESEELLEAALGLASEMLRFFIYEENILLQEPDVDGVQLANRIVLLLNVPDYPSIKVPGIRRFLVEIAICLMTHVEGYKELFKNSGMEMVLYAVADTVSEMECFNVFFGSVGLRRHRRDFSSIIDSALDLLRGV